MSMDSLKIFAQNLFSSKYAETKLFNRKHEIISFTDRIINICFPIRLNIEITSELQLLLELKKLMTFFNDFLDDFNNTENLQLDTDVIVKSFFDSLELLTDQLNQDALFILKEDPAANDLNEVLLTYPGFYAIALYRIANFFQQNKIPYLPRILTEHAHDKTGADIHPQAKIGCPFFLDHVTGVVIGETAIVGNSVKIYQGVTLGALSVDKEHNGTKRHPSIEDNCILYANCTILGGNTVIGQDSIIGGNVWLTKSVPAKSKIFNILKSNTK
jgi:serine O-acetyltransferase